MRRSQLLSLEVGEQPTNLQAYGALLTLTSNEVLVKVLFLSTIIALRRNADFWVTFEEVVEYIGNNSNFALNFV